MKSTIVSLWLLPLAGACGCGTHPTPKDVTGYDTYQIVQKIRCETRDAVRNKAIAFMSQKKLPLATQQLAAQLKSKPSKFETLKIKDLDDESFRFFDFYEEAVIGYDFTLGITLDNQSKFSIGLLNPFANGKRTVGATAGLNRNWKNSQNFKILDEMGNVARLNNNYCELDGKGQNYFYPMTGKIGMKQIIDRFIDLNQVVNWKPENDIFNYTTTLTFETKIHGSADPKVELVPVTSGVGISDTGYTGSSFRLDKHQVIVAISLPSDLELKPATEREANILATKNEVDRTLDFQRFLIERPRVIEGNEQPF